MIFLVFIDCPEQALYKNTKKKLTLNNWDINFWTTLLSTGFCGKESAQK